MSIARLNFPLRKFVVVALLLNSFGLFVAASPANAVLNCASGWTKHEYINPRTGLIVATQCEKWFSAESLLGASSSDTSTVNALSIPSNVDSVTVNLVGGHGDTLTTTASDLFSEVEAGVNSTFSTTNNGNGGAGNNISFVINTSNASNKTLDFGFTRGRTSSPACTPGGRTVRGGGLAQLSIGGVLYAVAGGGGGAGCGSDATSKKGRGGWGLRGNSLDPIYGGDGWNSLGTAKTTNGANSASRLTTAGVGALPTGACDSAGGDGGDGYVNLSPTPVIGAAAGGGCGTGVGEGGGGGASFIETATVATLFVATGSDRNGNPTYITTNSFPSIFDPANMTAGGAFIYYSLNASNSATTGTPLASPVFTTSAGNTSITGTITAVTNASGYTVTATPTAGGATVTCTVTSLSYSCGSLANGTQYAISVTANGTGSYSDSPPTVANETPTATPPSMSTTTSSISGTVGTAIAPSANIVAIGFTGSPIYTVSPVLPAGLSISASTGSISGTPTLVSASASYTITGTSGGQSATTTVTIVVQASGGGSGGISSGGGTPSPAQQSSITSVSPQTCSTAGGTPITIAGTFLTPVSSIQVNGVALSPSQWTQTATGIVVTMPALAAGAATIQIYNGQVPLLATQSVTYMAPTTAPSVTPSPSASPSPSTSPSSGTGTSSTTGTTPSPSTSPSTTPAPAPTQNGGSQSSITSAPSSNQSVITSVVNALTPVVNAAPAFAPSAPSQTNLITATTLPNERLSVRQIQLNNASIDLSGNSGLQVLGNVWNMAITAASRVIRVNPSNTGVTVPQGTNVNTFGSGFKPNSQIDIYVYSTPILVGSVISDSQGKYNVTLPIPRSLALGNHVFQAQGKTFDDLARKVNVPITLVSSASDLQSKRAFDVYFALSSSTLDAKAKSTIKTFFNQVSAKLTSKSVVSVDVTGWVQPTKSSPNIAQLSSGRAQAVVAYLKSLGLKAKYTVKAPGHDKVNAASSRRASVVIRWTS